MVEAAFKLMDKDNSGKLTTADIAQVFDVTNNQDF
jgi:Ca2+-binding EF-hand superfamily protein